MDKFLCNNLLYILSCQKIEQAIFSCTGHYFRNWIKSCVMLQIFISNFELLNCSVKMYLDHLSYCTTLQIHKVHMWKVNVLKWNETSDEAILRDVMTTFSLLSDRRMICLIVNFFSRALPFLFLSQLALKLSFVANSFATARATQAATSCVLGKYYCFAF